MPAPKKNVAFTTAVFLVDQSDSRLFKSNPTLASGDAKVDIDGAGFNNLGTLPSVEPTSSRRVKVVLAQAEMNGDIITVLLHDAAGAEWNDLGFVINTVTQTVEDLPNAAAIADAVWDEDLSGHTTSGTAGKQLQDTKSDTDDIQSRLPAALVSGRMDSSVGAYQSGLTPLQPTTAGRTLDVTAGGEAGIDWGNIGNPGSTVGLSGTTIKDVTDVETAIAALNNITVAEIFAQAYESTETFTDFLRLARAVLYGASTGQATAPAFKDLANSKTRVTATVDSSGNRSGVTLDAT